MNAASVNEQVLVCNGIYREQVTITTNGVDLLAKVVHGATIKSPSTGTLTEPRALVHIDGASGAKVRRFIIAGPGPGTVDSLRHGVLVETDPGDKDASVFDNRIDGIRDTEAAANENGEGIRIGRDWAGTAGRAIVLRNTVQRYQKAGIAVDGAGSFAHVANNTIRGLGLLTSPTTPVPAQQGIQVGRDAGADINTNSISLNQYSGTTGETSFGILVFNTDLSDDPLSSRISRLKTNTVFDNDYGILMQDAENQLIETNRVFANGDPSTAAADGGIGVFETSPGAGPTRRTGPRPLVRLPRWRSATLWDGAAPWRCRRGPSSTASAAAARPWCSCTASA